MSARGQDEQHAENPPAYQHLPPATHSHSDPSPASFPTYRYRIPKERDTMFLLASSPHLLINVSSHGYEHLGYTSCGWRLRPSWKDRSAGHYRLRDAAVNTSITAATATPASQRWSPYVKPKLAYRVHADRLKAAAAGAGNSDDGSLETQQCH